MRRAIGVMAVQRPQRRTPVWLNLSLNPILQCAINALTFPFLIRGLPMKSRPV